MKNNIVKAVLLVLLLITQGLYANQRETPDFVLGWYHWFDGDNLEDQYKIPSYMKMYGASSVMSYGLTRSEYLGENNGPVINFLDAIAEQDMWAIFELRRPDVVDVNLSEITDWIQTYDSHEAIWMWYLCDEPVFQGVNVTDFASVANTVEANSSKELTAVFGGDNSWQGYIDSLDCVSVDKYVVSATDPIPAPDMYRIAVRAKELGDSAALEGKKAYWVAEADADNGTFVERRFPTLFEQRYLSLSPMTVGVHGGIMYYTFSYAPLDPDYKDVYPIIFAQINHIKDAVSNGPVAGINVTSTKDSDTTGNGVNDITYEMYKDPGADKYFLVAVNNTYSNIGQQSFTISGLNIADGFQATVFDEQASGSFSFSISGNDHVLTDSFDAYSTHIYEIAVPQTSQTGVYLVDEFNDYHIDTDLWTGYPQDVSMAECENYETDGQPILWDTYSFVEEITDGNFRTACLDNYYYPADYQEQYWSGIVSNQMVDLSTGKFIFQTRVMRSANDAVGGDVVVALMQQQDQLTEELAGISDGDMMFGLRRYDQLPIIRQHDPIIGNYIYRGDSYANFCGNKWMNLTLITEPNDTGVYNYQFWIEDIFDEDNDNDTEELVLVDEGLIDIGYSQAYVGLIQIQTSYNADRVYWDYIKVSDDFLGCEDYLAHNNRIEEDLCANCNIDLGDFSVLSQDWLIEGTPETLNPEVMKDEIFLLDGSSNVVNAWNPDLTENRSFTGLGSSQVIAVDGASGKIAVGAGTAKFAVYESDGTRIYLSGAYFGNITAMAFQSNGNLVIGTSGGELYLRSASNYGANAAASKDFNLPITDIAVQSDDEIVFVTSNGYVYLRDPDLSPNTSKNLSLNFTSVAVRQSDDVVLLGSTTGICYLRDENLNNIVSKNLAYNISDVAFNSNGNAILIFSNGDVRDRGADLAQTSPKLQGLGNLVAGGVLSDDRIVVGKDDGTLLMLAADLSSTVGSVSNSISLIDIAVQNFDNWSCDDASLQINGDFNGDCTINSDDLKMLADKWLYNYMP